MSNGGLLPDPKDDGPNRFGLRRSDFRDPHKRALRQACGFGCVLCGRALYYYAHIDPAFADAKEHDIERMALLCSQHHDEHDKWKRLSTSEVMAARANPKALQDGFTRDSFSGPSDEFILTIGSNFFAGCDNILNIEGSDILRIDPPETANGPYRLSGIFCDSEGSLVASIVQNEIMAWSGTWDIEIEGPKITFRAAPRQICLVLITFPGKGLRIERMDMRWAGARVVTDDQQLVVTGTATYSRLLSDHTCFQDCEYCIQIQDGEVLLGDTRIASTVHIIGGAVLGRRALQPASRQ